LTKLPDVGGPPATMRAAAAGFVLEQDVGEMVAVAEATCPAR